jgi:hypothetical protein
MSNPAWLNPNGTVNGVKFFAALTGTSEAEIEWTWQRLKHLIRAEGKDEAEAKRIVKEEAGAKPWEAK